MVDSSYGQPPSIPPVSLRRNIIANFIGKGWSAISWFIFIPVYISQLGIENYGLIGLYFSLIALFSILDFGLSITLNRELASLSALSRTADRMRTLTRTLEIIYWVTAVIIAIVIIYFAPLIADNWLRTDVLSSESAKVSVMVMGLSIALQWPFTLYSGGLMGLQYQVNLNIINVIISTLRTVGAAIVVLWVSKTILAFFIWQAIISFSQSVFTCVYFWWLLPKGTVKAKFELAALLDIWKFTAGITGMTTLGVMLTQVDKIILSHMLSLEVFGYYSLAWMLAGSLYFIVAPINAAFFPQFSQFVTTKQDDKLCESYHLSSQLVTILVFPLTVLLTLFPKDILLLWTGDLQIATSGYKVLRLLAIGTALNCLMIIPSALQLSYKWIRLGLAFNLVAVVLFIPLVISVTNSYGVVGAAALWPVLNVSYILIVIPIMHKRILKQEKWIWYWRDVICPALIVVVIFIAGKSIVNENLINISGLTSLFFILVASVLGALYMAPLLREKTAVYVKNYIHDSSFYPFFDKMFNMRK